MKLRLGTRGSRLALAQADIAKKALEGLGFNVDLVIVRTKGDICKDRPVEELERGTFVKEIERKLFEGNIDLAVHSAKDMPSKLPEGLEVVAYLKREDPSDCLVTPDGRKLDELE
ncbi:MAG TPA: hydroxymethylbilane synthase, partial [Candidatus Latescibacteria bacterium]|nr:hydroxymethylbilane synthase [Candidatus Latescibacterota bacterium]